MKKRIVFTLVVLVLLCFAMPAIASPPLEVPTIEAVGPDIGIYQTTPVALEVASIAINSGGLALAVNYFETVSTRESTSLIEYVSFGNAPMLAGLMYGVVSNSVRETRIAKDYYVSAEIERVNMGARRWV